VDARILAVQMQLLPGTHLRRPVN